MFAEVVLSLPLDKAFHYSIPEHLKDKIKPGSRVTVPFGSKHIPGFVTALTESSPVRDVKPIAGVIDDEPVFDQRTLELARWISYQYLCSLGEALGAIVPIRIQIPKRAQAESENTVLPEPSRPPVFTPTQRTALDSIEGKIVSKEYGTFVLHGVTSSGKTEVYLAAMAKALELNRSAIYLLPEISLTPQFINIVRKRFPGGVGVWHSKLTVTEKFWTWEAARQGKIKIMLGARSAVFAPFRELGLIIVDEEHEPTYKQEQKPAYHTREVAVKRSQLSASVCVFGSATPSLETYWRAKTGEYTLLEMHERVDSRALPPVELIDLRPIRTKYRMITRPLHEAITKTLAKREQAIIFLNRRGFSPGITCPKCGNVWECPRCSVSLVYHKVGENLQCHYCNYKHDWPAVCPTCKNTDLSVFGIGTQKVEAELIKLFPQAKVFRLDRDTAAKKDVYHKAYEDFKNENYDILIGTQMVSKGFDFPRVTLVGVIDADTALHLPDFRAAERTFQLITQVAGRSGRSDLGGEVIVQTCYPDHYAMLAAKDHDYRTFYNKEIDFRRQINYPPFSRLVNIMVRAAKEEKAIESINKIYDDLLMFMATTKKKIELLGPTPCAHIKLKRLFRWQVLVKGDAETVLEAAHAIRSYYLPKGVLLNIDVDPYAVL